ncbi:MAG: tetratricopeptide repeat protein [Proteobacteria bacterium]|nr:tetratricopeptide repeat protein [Pseudomonadota bacterium]
MSADVTNPADLIQLGLQLHQAGQLQDAEKTFRQVLAQDADNADANYLLGALAYHAGNFADAVDLVSRAIAAAPDHPVCHNILGLALQGLGRLQDADDSYQRALELNPDFPEAHINLANVMQDLGRMEDAVAGYAKAIALTPGFAEAHNNLGNALKELGRYTEARLSLEKAVALKPDLAEAHSNLGATLKEIGLLDEAVVSYQRALALQPDLPEAQNNLGNVLQSLGRHDEAAACYGKALALNPDFPEAHSSLLFCYQYRAGSTAETLFEAHSEWGQRHAEPLRSTWTPHTNDRDPARKLNIGLVSSDLGVHPVGYFSLGLFENKPADEIALICYSAREPDSISERLKAASDGWHETRGLSDIELAEKIRADGIDILFDLSAHSRGSRLLMFARKPAPIQITWAGYVGTTGLKAMDYLLADRHYIPDGGERFYTESIIYMPDAYVTYTPPDFAPAVGPPPLEKNGFLTFGVFNNPAKINAVTLETWMTILNAVPNSRLVLKYKGVDSVANSSRFQDAFAAAGLDPSRLILEGAATPEEMMARYNDIDIALDTFPYNGGLTTCEALWMGVPVVTLVGNIFAGRHALSHLSTVGLAELAAEDTEAYVALTVKLANDPPRLTGLRAGLRERMAASPLCDEPRFARNFADAMRNVWQAWCSGKSD